jgi:hypothetical protein
MFSAFPGVDGGRFDQGDDERAVLEADRDGAGRGKWP